jgi:hypothetical protein
MYEALEARGVQYAVRIPANNKLELAVEDILFRSSGRPSLKPLIRYKSFQYQADSWTAPRRVVARVAHHTGELFPRVGFIVTNRLLRNRAVVRFYNKRGTAEQWIKRGKQAAHWTRLSCHRFRANEVRLQLSALAYNPRELVAATRAAGANRGLVAHQSPAAHCRDGWAAGQARAVLRVDVRRELSDAAAVRGDAPADLGAPGGGGLAERWVTTQSERDLVRAVAARALVRLRVAPRAITGGVDEREVLPSHDVSCANLNSPSRANLLLSGAIGPPKWKSRFRSPRCAR